VSTLLASTLGGGGGGGSAAWFRPTVHAATANRVRRTSAIPQFDAAFSHRRLGVLLHNEEVVIQHIELLFGRKRAFLHACVASQSPQRATAQNAPQPWLSLKRYKSSTAPQQPERSQLSIFGSSVPQRPIARAATVAQRTMRRLRTSLARSLRRCDVTIVLPSAARSLAQLDHALKEVLATDEFPEFSKYVLGQFVDSAGHHVLVLEDLRSTSLHAQMATFAQEEDHIVWKARCCSPARYHALDPRPLNPLNPQPLQVLVPLLTSVARLHRAGIAHRSLCPATIFWASGKQRSGNVYCSLPCPAAWPDHLNSLLLDSVPDDYFPPELWVREG